MHRLLLTDFEQLKKISSFLLTLNNSKKLVVILLTLNNSKIFCNELLQNIYHSQQGSVAERTESVIWHPVSHTGTAQ